MVTDLDKTQRFAEDFGLKTVRKAGSRLYMRTDGGDAYSYVAEQGDERRFIGLGFTVESEADLEEAVREHGGTPIVELDGPGGGRATTLTSPEGLKFELIYGIVEDQPKAPQPHLRLNAPGERSRFAAPQSERPAGPATLFRLGHVGLYAKDFAANAEWLQNVMGMKLSDALYAQSPDHAVVGFFRLDHGAEWVDHHTIFIGAMGMTGLHHLSFEVQDFEAQFRTHRYLQDKGWDPNWGVGRHPLGSHVFDVWFDPDRFRFETFSDTDLLNDEHETGLHAIKEQDMDCWSSDPPDRYFAP
ncbi:2,3-dihydroxybiphenyl 1,2-dioxygenase [Novosphingobium endophyticum]|uniref:2,3-dihydroxybiphenyl 1,2-dioxygenase n=1 Tax=Novosphingobium endophyticum TaxID=1955250 RepID=A0A916X4S2_9SPHN|nr:2,3-dihydroxybiphenyl 1,2-dioxygenase [Novosphingobium endophyticum]